MRTSPRGGRHQLACDAHHANSRFRSADPEIDIANIEKP